MTAPAAVDALVLPMPIGKQPEWLDSPASRKLLRVGRRGTKTRFAFTASILGHGPGWEDDRPKFGGVLSGGDVVWICPTYSNLSTVLWREEIVPRMAHLPYVDLNVTLHDVNIRGLGSLLLRSGDREAIDSVRGVGKRLKGVIVDEAAHMDLRGALQDVILPALLDNDGWLILMSTTNVDSDGGYDDTGAPQQPSYFNVLCGEVEAGKRSSDWEQFVGTAFDNPTLNPQSIRDLIAEYPEGSPKLRQEIYAELLEVGVGLALPGLSKDSHLVPAFTPPSHWNTWAGFDWGYHHPWAFGLYASDEDGQVYKVCSLSSRLDLPDGIDAKVRAAGVDPRKLHVYAGPDAWRARQNAKGKIKGEFLGPTIAEQLQGLGWKMVPAADARVAGLNNFRSYTFIDPKIQPPPRPRFVWMDEPGNVACLEQCARIQVDPKNVEDALKVDASSGRGGDDHYDETRYALMARPIASQPAAPPEPNENQSLGYDFKNHRPRVRLSGEAEFEQMFDRAQGRAGVGRNRLPRG